MTVYNIQHVRNVFEQSDEARTAAEKGRLLEDLMCYFFELIPGVSITKRNVLNAFNTEEIDVAIWNEQQEDGLKFLPSVILVECKNWSQAIGSQEVSYFANRLAQRGCVYGILVAARGITGEAQSLTAAHYELSTAQSKGIRILIITRQELENMVSTDRFIHLLKEKICELVVAGTVFAYEPEVN
jgi:hypothetical protein